MRRIRWGACAARNTRDTSVVATRKTRYECGRFAELLLLLLLLGLLLQPDLLLLPLMKKSRAHRNICGDGSASPKLLIHEPTGTEVTIQSTTARELLLLLLLLLMVLMVLLVLLVLLLLLLVLLPLLLVLLLLRLLMLLMLVLLLVHE